MNHKALITIFLIASIGSNLIPPASAEFESIRINEVFNGYVLFAPEFSKETYLIDIDKNILHTWESDYVQALGTYLMENGNLIRSCAKFNNTFFKMGGFTGRVEMYDWNGSLIWEFDYSNENHCLHHDLEVLPNGNILMIAWESKSQSEAIQAGINLSNINGKQLWADYIIEVKPLNSSEGEIVWEWHVWDHLIQEYDSSKDNFGIISLHPELIDINSYKNKFNVQIIDFNHINSIDYNEELDQILLSSRQQNEIWIIDHSTTTEEAAGHTGGRYGKGGDLLYRWGNPQIYRRGTSIDRMLFEQHDAQWIEKGCPGEGNILIFNNGVDRPDGRYSSIIEISPPIMINGNYRLIPGESYGPKELIWQYTATNPNDFSAKSMSGAQRLPNGNTIVCDGSEGYIFEISPSYEIIWDYQISFSSLPLNDIFKIHKYSPDYPGLSALFTKPDKPIIDGPTSGKINNEYTFSATINNSENDSVYYLFDWGDGSKSNWLGPYKSNIICTANHSWKRRGDFSVRVKVKDINGLESDWSIHPIKMAKFKLIDFLIMNIGNNNPYLFSFYQTIYGHNFFKNK